MKTMTKIKAILFSMLVLVMGCATSSGGLEFEGKQEVGPNYPSLLIQNTGIDVLRIYENGRRIATVYPSQEECVFLRSAISGTTELSFGYLGSPRSVRWIAQQSHFNRQSGWAWVINSNQPTLSGIFPTERCE